MTHSLIMLSMLAVLLRAQHVSPEDQKKNKLEQERRQAERRGDTLGSPKLAGSLPGQRFSPPDKQGDWPAIGYARDGSLYAAWVEWNDKDADRIVVRRKSAQGEWLQPVPLEDGSWDHYSPTVAACGEDAMVIWPAQVDGNFELFAARVGPSGASKTERLTRAPFGDFNARAVCDKSGSVTVVWQSFRRGNSDVFVRRHSAGKWGPEVLVSTSGSSEWEPDIAAEPNGRVWISYDSYRAGNYDVFLRSYDGRALGPEIAITTETSAQFHSSVAVDPQGRVWVAWDDAGENWGKDFSISSSAPGSQGLHYSRKIGMRVFANGRVQEPQADLARIMTGKMARYAELPHLMFDGSGALWMVFRYWTTTLPFEIYHFYAARLTGGAWEAPYLLERSAGQNSQRASLSLSPSGGITVAYSSDSRTPEGKPESQAHALHFTSWTTELARAAVPVAVKFADVKLPKPAVKPPPRPRHTMTANGRKYVLMMGDCHRHTDIRGHSGVDGSLLDTYRYAIDAGQLDFLGVADHNETEGGRWPDSLRDYQWWWTQKAVDLFNHDPAFVSIYSYEHSMGRPAGHRNVLFLKRGAPLRMIDRSKVKEDNLPPRMWEWWEKNVLTQPGQKSIIVPHTFASGPLADWNWPNARFDCLLEIYQGSRGSYEAWRLPAKEKRGPTQTDEPGHFAQDALARGNIYGFVSFSDHFSTHNSWASVWVMSQDRKGIIDAMYDRRTFAGTDEIVIRATADGHMPGEEFELPAGRAPRIDARFDAPDKILRVDVVKDGKYIHTARPAGGRSFSLSFRDNDAKPGKTYYYLRVFQRDTEKPDGDPEIGWTSPFFVTYK